MSCFFKIDIHIIPARAPIGVRYAPIFEPTIDAYIAWLKWIGFAELIIDEKNTVIGILLIILQKTVDDIR